MKATKLRPVKVKNPKGNMSGTYAHKKLTEAINRLNKEMGLPEGYGKNLRAWK